MPVRKNSVTPPVQEPQKQEKSKKTVAKRPQAEKETSSSKKTKTEQNTPQTEPKRVVKHRAFARDPRPISEEGAGYIKGFYDGSLRLMSQKEYAEIFNLSPMGVLNYIGGCGGKYKEVSDEDRKAFIAHLLKYVEDGETFDFHAKKIPKYMEGIIRSRNFLG